MYLSSILHIILLVQPGSRAAAGNSTALLSAAQHNGVLVEIAGTLHGHSYGAGLLTHVVAEGTAEDKACLRAGTVWLLHI